MVRLRCSEVPCLIWLCVSILACSPTTKTAKSSTKPSELIFSVAASTKDVMEELAAVYTREHPNVMVKVNPGPSSSLAQQIIEGAPVDLFLSANVSLADQLIAANKVHSHAPLLSNRLVLIVPKGNPAQVTEPADLLKTEMKHIALAGEKVPAGMYADQALFKLDLLTKLNEQNKIARGQDARNTLSFVERGEAEAGIVYATDITHNSSIEAVYEFDSNLHDPIVYVLMQLKTEASATSATEFYNYLQTPQAKAIYSKHEFTLANTLP